MHHVRSKPARRSFVRAAGALAALAAVGLAGPAQADDTARMAAARAAVTELAETLKGELTRAMAKGGPAALAVCRTAAPAVAGTVSATHGMEVGRTALKVRNPANAPDAFERRVLEDFARRIDAGAEVATLDHAERVVEGGETVLRYMKAIPTAAAPCLACHGTAIEPALAAEIVRLYPDDAATGFSAGDLRGAFTVTQRVR